MFVNETLWTTKPSLLRLLCKEFYLSPIFVDIASEDRNVQIVTSNFSKSSEEFVVPESLATMKCALSLLLTTVLVGLVASDTPTVVPANPFNSYDDAKAIHAIVSAWFPSRSGVLDVLCHRIGTQRGQVADTYLAAYGHTLIADLDGLTSGDMKNLCHSLASKVEEYLTDEMKRMLVDSAEDLMSVEEILLSRSNKDIKNIDLYYTNRFGTTLKDAIDMKYEGDVKQLISQLSDGTRTENKIPVNKAKVDQDALDLFNAGQKVNETAESVFTDIFSARSYNHLNAMFLQYEVTYGSTMESTIRSKFSGDFEYLLLNIVRYSKNKSAYFAQRLHDTVNVKSPDKLKLMRLIISRCEIDLGDVKAELEEIFQMDLASVVSSKTSGDFRNGLLQLIG